MHDPGKLYNIGLFKVTDRDQLCNTSLGISSGIFCHEASEGISVLVEKL